MNGGMKAVLLFCCFAVFAWLPYSVRADGVVGNFAVCDTCVDATDFAQAARVWFGQRSVRSQVTVGNPVSGVLYTMWVSPGRGSSEMAANVASYKTISGRWGEKVAVLSPENNVIRASQLVSSASVGSQGSVSGEFEDHKNEPVFNAIVSANKQSIMFYVTDAQVNVYGDALSSYSLATPEIMGKVIWSEEDMVNPGFLSSTWSLLGAVQNALNSYFGRGIQATIIFKNGDVATYQINMLDPNATRPILGSARDRYGRVLPDAPAGIGGRGGASVSVPSQGGADVTGYGMGSGSGEVWWVCSFVGGQLQGCYSTTEKP